MSNEYDRVCNFSPLTSLLSRGGGRFPIDVGSILRHLVSNISSKEVNKDMEKYFNEFESGVGVSGGIKTILHITNTVLSKQYGVGYLAMLILDLSDTNHC